MTDPWRDRERLYDLWIVQNKDSTEIGEMFGCDPQTILNWVDRFGFEYPWEDEEWLRQEYVEKGKTMEQIADENNTSHTTIYRRIRDSDIEIEKPSQRPATLSHVKGYLQWQCGVNGEYVKVHRLTAVAKYGFDALKDKHVHHDNEVRWDNRPENLKVMLPDEHMGQHREYSWLDEIRIRELYDNSPATFKVLADQFDVSIQTISNIVNGSRNCRFAKIEAGI